MPTRKKTATKKPAIKSQKSEVAVSKSRSTHSDKISIMAKNSKLGKFLKAYESAKSTLADFRIPFYIPGHGWFRIALTIKGCSAPTKK